MEIVAPSNRVQAATAISLSYTLGEALLGVVQYLTYDWRTTIRVLYTPCITFISYYWLMSESVRWLLAKNRPEDAFAVLKRIAKVNGRNVSDEMIKNVICFEIRNASKVIQNS